MRESISPSKRFAVTLRYYVAGGAQSTITTSYRVCPLKVFKILTEKSNEIWSILMKESFLDVPHTEN